MYGSNVIFSILLSGFFIKVKIKVKIITNLSKNKLTKQMYNCIIILVGVSKH